MSRDKLEHNSPYLLIFREHKPFLVVRHITALNKIGILLLRKKGEWILWKSLCHRPSYFPTGSVEGKNE